MRLGARQLLKSEAEIDEFPFPDAVDILSVTKKEGKRFSDFPFSNQRQTS